MRTLISASELARVLTGAGDPVLLDVRWRLGGPHGRPEYRTGHLPGAVFVDLDAELAGPPGAAGRHPLPDVEAFGAVMRRAGVSANRPVVVYDGGSLSAPGGGWAAARAWWLLRWAGHPDVRVLDGGLPAWQAAGGALSTADPVPTAGDFQPRPGAMPVLDAEGAGALARDGLLLDARSAERYRGDSEPIDRVGGHIPGALSAPTTENVTPDGHLRPPGDLAERFAGLGVREGEPVGVYCGSGVSAAQQVLALATIGVEASLYVGSWSEWSADPARPVATGPQPG